MRAPVDPSVNQHVVPRRRTFLVLPLVCWCLGLAMTPAAAQEPDPGRFEVRSASVELKDGVYYLDAWLEYRLSTEARQALEAGVPLRIEIEVEFLRVRRFWFDDSEAALRQTYDVVILVAPAVIRRGEARLLAAKVDYVVLLSMAPAGEPTSRRARDRLVDAGAQDVEFVRLETIGPNPSQSAA